ncbi:MAG: metallophosphoesterase family protein [Opitutales bacterium]
MQALIIPDIHQNVSFARGVLMQEDPERFDRIICLGDYFDARDPACEGIQHLENAARFVRELQDAHAERLDLLCGNHDIPYYAMRPACLEDGRLPNWTLGQAMRESRMENARIINGIWDESLWRGLKVAVLVDGWLLSHAGVHKKFWPDAGGAVEEKVRRLSEEWEHAMDTIFEEPEHPLFCAGFARGGLNAVGGPLWQDWNLEFEDTLEVPQVVGHTRNPSNPRKGRSVCIDFAQTAYAVLQDGALTVKTLT